MKQKRRKPSRPYIPLNRSTPKNTSGAKASSQNSNTIGNSTKQNNGGFMDSLQMLGKMANNFSQSSSELEQMIKAFQSFSTAIQDRNAFKQMIQALAKLNQSQVKPPTPSTNPASNPASNPATPSTPSTPASPSTNASTKEGNVPTLGGADTLYDLFNSPAMNNLVKTILSNRNKR